jgi:threonine/homoserine/homoserine lactone efflux protein
MTGSGLIGFIAASVAFTMAPGPDTTFVLAQGISRGRKAAMITALGMCSGVTVHTTAAALGISAAVYSFAPAFMILKTAGAIYLLVLAWKAVRHPSIARIHAANGTPQSGWTMFRRGFLMNVLNPKVGLFFLAFLPQFVTRGSGGSIPLQMFLLGLVFMGQAVVVMPTIGYLSGAAGELLTKRPETGKYFSWLSAAIFAVLGLKLALARR